MGDTVIFNLGSISNGATATATIRVITGTAGTIVNTATVSTASTDLYLAAATTVNSTTVTVPSPSYLVATNLGSGILQLTLEGQEGPELRHPDFFQSAGLDVRAYQYGLAQHRFVYLYRYTHQRPASVLPRHSPCAVKLFGITGGAGMGKSTAGQLLRQRGVEVADTDAHGPPIDRTWAARLAGNCATLWRAGLGRWTDN